ncbi:hypothetical protein [Peterkaempfera bronchialis]|uniref:Uncharacterized protein n=1 Tax=Peterkaempfera bronchialis TaxID=2126346 RepID=A0A345T3X0_9ACTN|nr:hypothetical protein [Peterkaempfera bronchialis]AXI80675.1 hypothetical protein C7M71_028085 [Peterkaempfera bronchialis]
MAAQFGGPVRRRWTPSAGRAAEETRHPLVAVAIALPFAVLLSVVFGGWHQVMVQAQSVAAMIGR